MHPEHTQPDAQQATEEAFAKLVAEHVPQQAPAAHQQSAQTQLLPLLHAITQRYGHIDEVHVRALAQALNLSRAEVFGVVTFYQDFSLIAAPVPCIEVCAAEACQARGANALLHATQGQPEVRAVYCLGNCTAGPSVRVGDRVLGKVTIEALRALCASRIDSAAGAMTP